VMLGEADRVVAEPVGELRLRGELAEHALVEIGAEPGEAGLDLGATPDRGEVEEGDLHDRVLGSQLPQMKVPPRSFPPGEPAG